MTILQALDRYYDRMAARGEVVSPGFSVEPIGFVIVLRSDGTVADVALRTDDSGKRPRQERVPKWFSRQGIGSTPFFLWDNTAYALGVSTKDPAKTARDYASFRELHFRTLRGEGDRGLLAVRRFLEAWTPDQFAPPLFDEKMLAWNLAFQLDGEHRFVHEREAARDHIDRLRLAVGAEKKATCLVTGLEEPFVTLHPKIKGVDGTASPEVPLVSFNTRAFESYGKKQGANAPTSETAAFRYGAALNALLARGTSRNRLPRPLGDATVVFWADTSNVVSEEAAGAAEDLFLTLFDPPAASKEEDAGAVARVRDMLRKFAEGRPLKEMDVRLEPSTRFNVLGLSPNAARLSVRYWLTDSFEAFARRLALHYQDLLLEPQPRGWGEAPSVNRLLVRTTALQEKFDNIPPLLAGEVTRAVLSGARYPHSLLAAAIIRLRAGDDAGSGWHAAVIKACINRALRHGRGDETTEEEVPVALDPTYDDRAYQLGRLFAVLEQAQRAALGRVNATIGDRYYAAASATPARVFGALLRSLKHHVSDARKQGKGGWIEPKVAEIIARLPPDLPRTLNLQEQGRFAVGYYHQKATRPAAEAENSEPEGGNDDQ
jgi:CRISPR-associated protein Csd1